LQTRNRTALILLGATVAFAVASLPLGRLDSYGVALACSCDPPPSASAERDESDVVFVGVATALTKAPSVGFYDVTFSVERVYKGAVASNATARTTSGAACGVDIAIGQRWLVYAGKSTPIELSGCSRTALVTEAGGDIEALGLGYAPESSTTVPAHSAIAPLATDASSTTPSSTEPAQSPPSPTCGRCALSSGAADAGGWLFAAALAATLLRRKGRTRHRRCGM